MRLLLAFCVFAFLSGCASTQLMRDCEQQGNSQYWHCKKV